MTSITYVGLDVHTTNYTAASQQHAIVLKPTTPLLSPNLSPRQTRLKSILKG